MVVDIVDTKPSRGRVEIRTGIGRKRRWPDEEKGRIVAEAVAPGAIVTEVARRHELTPQHLFTWIRAAKDGKLALPADTVPAPTSLTRPGSVSGTSFVPVVVEPAETPKPALCRKRAAAIEIAIGSIKMRIRNDADVRIVEAVLRAGKRVSA